MFQAPPPPQPPAQVIVVTGTALPDPAADRAQHKDVIARKELSDAPAHALDAILAQVPGLQLFRRSDSGSGHPTSQGVTLRALGGNASSRAALVLDGVPQADPFGGWINWPAYDPAGLDQVQILRSGGAVSYGPGALAGIIDMRSRADHGLDGSLEAGSRDSVRGHAFVGEALAGGLLTLDAQGGRSDGFIPITRATRGPVDRAAPFSEASIRGRWIAQLGRAVEMQAGGLAFIDKRERGVPFTSNRTRGGDLSLRFVGRGRWQWEALGYGQWRNLRSSFASVNDDRTSASRVSLQDSVPSDGFGGRFEVRPPLGSAFNVRVGADARRVSGESRELYAFVAGAPTRRRISGGDSSTAGLFAEASASRGAFTITGGARIDHWSISNGQLVERPLGAAPTRDDSYADRSGWIPTGRVSAVLDLPRDLELRAAAYKGWRLPTLNELFRPFRAGSDATAANALLDPETVGGIEAGLSYRRGGVGVQLTGFANRLSDAIANVTLGHGPGNFPGVGFVAGEYRQRQNVHAINVRGAEASAEIRHGPWSARVGASWTHARVEANGPAEPLDGLRPAQTPNIALTGALSWDADGRSASLIVHYAGSQFDDDLNQRLLPAATTVDAFLAWPLGKSLQIIARGENLLNEKVIAGIDDRGVEERATPRTLWLGLRLRSR